MLKSLEVRPERKRVFKRECFLIVQKILKKIAEASPLNSRLVRVASVLSPVDMAENKRENSNMKFRILTEEICKSKRITTREADRAIDQFDDFLGSVVIPNKHSFARFERDVDSVDEFLGVYLHKVPKFADLWKICSIVFTLSHGQAAIERGFSVNKEVLDDNMKTLSLVSQRMVYDHITSEKVH